MTSKALAPPSYRPVSSVTHNVRHGPTLTTYAEILETTAATPAPSVVPPGTQGRRTTLNAKQMPSTPHSTHTRLDEFDLDDLTLSKPARILHKPHSARTPSDYDLLVETTREYQLFRDTPKTLHMELLRAANLAYVNTLSPLYRAGEKATALHLVIGGTADIFVDHPLALTHSIPEQVMPPMRGVKAHAQQIIKPIKSIGVGDHVGDTPLLRSLPVHSVTIIATTPLLLMEIPKAAYLASLEQNRSSLLEEITATLLSVPILRCFSPQQIASFAPLFHLQQMNANAAIDIEHSVCVVADGTVLLLKNRADALKRRKMRNGKASSDAAAEREDPVIRAKKHQRRSIFEEEERARQKRLLLLARMKERVNAKTDFIGDLSRELGERSAADDARANDDGLYSDSDSDHESDDVTDANAMADAYIVCLLQKYDVFGLSPMESKTSTFFTKRVVTHSLDAVKILSITHRDFNRYILNISNDEPLRVDSKILFMSNADPFHSLLTAHGLLRTAILRDGHSRTQAELIALHHNFHHIHQPNPFLSSISTESQIYLLQSMSIESVCAHRIICEESDEANAARLILNGTVSLFVRDESGEVLLIGVVGRGALIGHLPIMVAAERRDKRLQHNTDRGNMYGPSAYHRIAHHNSALRPLAYAVTAVTNGPVQLGVLHSQEVVTLSQPPHSCASQQASMFAFLTAHPLCQNMTTQRLLQLCQCIRTITFSAQECVSVQGESADGLFILVSGTVQLLHEVTSQRAAAIKPFHLAKLDVNDYFGENSVLDSTHIINKSTAVCTVRTALIFVPTIYVRRLFSKSVLKVLKAAYHRKDAVHIERVADFLECLPDEMEVHSSRRSKYKRSAQFLFHKRVPGEEDTHNKREQSHAHEEKTRSHKAQSSAHRRAVRASFSDASLTDLRTDDVSRHADLLNASESMLLHHAAIAPQSFHPAFPQSAHLFPDDLDVAASAAMYAYQTINLIELEHRDRHNHLFRQSLIKQCIPSAQSQWLAPIQVPATLFVSNVYRRGVTRMFSPLKKWQYVLSIIKTRIAVSRAWIFTQHRQTTFGQHLTVHPTAYDLPVDSDNVDIGMMGVGLNERVSRSLTIDKIFMPHTKLAADDRFHPLSPPAIRKSTHRSSVTALMPTGTPPKSRFENTASGVFLTAYNETAVESSDFKDDMSPPLFPQPKLPSLHGQTVLRHCSNMTKLQAPTAPTTVAGILPPKSHTMSLVERRSRVYIPPPHRLIAMAHHPTGTEQRDQSTLLSSGRHTSVQSAAHKQEQRIQHRKAQRQRAVAKSAFAYFMTHGERSMQDAVVRPETSPYTNTTEEKDANVVSHSRSRSSLVRPQTTRSDACLRLHAVDPAKPPVFEQTVAVFKDIFNAIKTTTLERVYQSTVRPTLYIAFTLHNESINAVMHFIQSRYRMLANAHELDSDCQWNSDSITAVDLNIVDANQCTTLLQAQREDTQPTQVASSGRFSSIESALRDEKTNGEASNLDDSQRTQLRRNKHIITHRIAQR